MFDLIMLVPLIVLWLICAALYVLFLAMSVKMFWHATKEWKRAFKQAFKILKHAKDNSPDDDGYPWWKQVVGVVVFAFSDYGRVYQTMEVNNPSTGATTTFAYNGEADFKTKGTKDG